ncbi:hypothetical protein [Pyxidicoccus trucidator]|uniref:hypothetical protein n=1 Tax=Pyxidicoccus trucidator TaxID=2709662 RepID=UPI0013DC23CB|nr:hypothetical protein [Pyxidicoccus trucidator]
MSPGINPHSLPAIHLAGLLSEQASRAHGSTPGPFLRALSRVNAIGRDFNCITAGDPNWLTDLGLRRSPEPREYFHAHASALLDERMPRDVLGSLGGVDHCLHALSVRRGGPALSPSFDFGPFVRDAAANDVSVLSQVLHCYVNVLGSWEDAESLVRPLVPVARDLKSGDIPAFVLTCAANVLATSADPACRELYQLASVRWQDPQQRLFTQLRLAAAELKRLLDAGRTEAALDEAARLAAALPHAPDATFCGALVKNLRALARVRAKRLDEAEVLICEAWRELEASPAASLTLEPRVGDRYRVQVLENMALLASMKEDWARAVEVFERAAALAGQHHPESLDEALSLLGFALIRAGQPSRALELLLPAESRVAQHVAPLRLRQIWKLIAVAFDGAGDRVSAGTWLGRLEQSEAGERLTFAGA